MHFIIGTLCYCDQFCTGFVNGDCCPDYESFCLGIEPPPELLELCEHKGQTFKRFETIKDNCNLW